MNEVISQGEASPNLAEGLVALRLVVLGEVNALPGGVARLAERLRLQAEFRLEAGANHEAAIGRAMTSDGPVNMLSCH